VKPVSLLGANSAGLQVTLKADDEATSGLYSSGTTSGADAEISRFGKNDKTTRVRVDSLKLFEVSSFASQLMAPNELNPSLNPAAFSSLTAHTLAGSGGAGKARKILSRNLRVLTRAIL
jgi:hypothetical protein